MQKKIQKAMLIVLVLLSVAALSVGITLAVVNGSRPACSCCARDLPSAPEATGGQQTEPVEKDSASISIPGFDFLSLRADVQEQSMPLYNPSVNSCYFRISLLVDGEQLWRSELLAPGQNASQQTLSRPLAAGEYSATLKYACFADEAETLPLNGSEIGLTLRVQG